MPWYQAAACIVVLLRGAQKLGASRPSPDPRTVVEPERHVARFYATHSHIATGAGFIQRHCL